MRACVLMGSPKAAGNTAALLSVFLEEWEELGHEARVIPLYRRKVAPCLGCMACQDCLDSLGCVQRDDLPGIFAQMADSDVILLATPIYAWFCTAPMKALMDRVIYAGVKNYGKQRGPALLEGRRVASLVTCGYPPERGADLWEEGLRRWCRHGKMEYMGMFCRRDLGRVVPFLDEDRALAVRDFAQALALAIKVEEHEQKI